MSFINTIHEAIVSVTSSTGVLQEEWNSLGLAVRPIEWEKDWGSVGPMMATGSLDKMGTSPHQKVSTFFGIAITKEDSPDLLVGFATFYLSYSTWDGKYIYVDHFHTIPSLDKEAEKVNLVAIRTLASVAVRLDCARLTWRHVGAPAWSANLVPEPEQLEGILTLSMDDQALIAYGGKQGVLCDSANDRVAISAAIEKCLTTSNEQAKDSTIRLRLATADDVTTIARMVQGLATYINEPDGVNLTEADYLADGFGVNPLFHCILIDSVADSDDASPITIGVAVVYVGYKTKKGKFIYLEDLFIEEKHRKQGGGTLSMKALAQIAQALGCGHLYWQALDWNAPALDFYKSIGAIVQDEVVTSRFTEDALKAFASGSKP